MCLLPKPLLALLRNLFAGKFACFKPCPVFGAMCTLFVLFSFGLRAQSRLKGRITDEEHLPLVGVSIRLEGSTLGTVTDEKGFFSLQLPQKSTRTIKTDSGAVLISYVGYQPLKVLLSAWKNPFKTSLKPSSKKLDEVLVSGKNQATEAKESAFKPEIIDMKKYAVQSSPVVQLIALMPGIKLRQNGGLGSDYNLIVNGVSGKGIPVVVDGIPVNLLSEGYQLNNISSEIIGHIEVYKGVVPARYGADALGGLIAIKTNRRFKPYFDASYSFGSWNTHQAYIGGKYLLGKHQYIAVHGSYQHSDNSYKMDDVQVVVDKLGNTESRSVRRFHDDYDMFLGIVEYGFQQTSWADDFRISISGNKVSRELQHGVTATEPWGDAKNSSTSYRTDLSWEKSVSENLQFALQAGYGVENRVFVDTSSYSYSWDGKAHSKGAAKGESGFYVDGRLPNIDYGKSYLRVMANYRISPTQTINFTSLGSYSSIQGTDIAAVSTFSEDIYKVPQHLTKIYAGVSWESKWLGEKVTNILALKGLYSSSDIFVIKEDFSVRGPIRKRQEQIGYSNALKYSFNRHWFAHLNYERSVRLPDEEEIFGDGLQILPNGNLKPEQSHNFNLGVSRKKKSEFYIGGFLRNISNQIFLNAITSTQTAYINFRATKTVGIEFSTTVRITPAFNALANGTWLRTTLEEVDPTGTIKPRYIGSRIPNTPFFFGNAGFAYSLKDLIQTESNTTITLSNRFLYRYFLGWEIDGNAEQKAKIPTQLLSDLSVVYRFPNRKISLSAECRNITNQKAYDNYKVQKPGRSFYTKIKISF